MSSPDCINLGENCQQFIEGSLAQGWVVKRPPWKWKGRKPLKIFSLVSDINFFSRSILNVRNTNYWVWGSNWAFISMFIILFCCSMTWKLTSFEAGKYAKMPDWKSEPFCITMESLTLTYRAFDGGHMLYGYW